MKIKLISFILLTFLTLSLFSCTKDTPADHNKTETIYTNDGPRVGDISLESFCIYGEYLTDSDYDYLIKSIKNLTGYTLKKGVFQDKHLILFDVDPSINDLTYKIQIKDQNINASVSDKLYIPYLVTSFLDTLSTIPNQIIDLNYSKTDLFILDEAINFENIEYICETNKNPFDYSIGEDVTFNIFLTSNKKLVSVPHFKIEYIDDEGNKDEITLDGNTGKATYTHSGLKSSGEAMISISALDESNNLFSNLSKAECKASVIYDFNNLNVHIEKPDDFDTFWDSTMSSILEYTPSAISSIICPNCSDKDFNIYLVTIKTSSEPAYVHISIPKNAQDNSLSIILDCPSAGGPESRNFKANSNAITISINKHSCENHKTKKYYSDYEKKIGDNFLTNCEIVDKTNSYFMDLITRDIQSIIYCENTYNSLWDKATIIVKGGSMGGFQAAVVASLYTKVTECIINNPWVCDIGANYRSTNIPNGNVHYTKNSKYFDACYFAPRFLGDVTINTGFGDDDCTINTAVALYNSFINANSKSITGKQTMGHIFDGASNESFTISNTK